MFVYLWQELCLLGLDHKLPVVPDPFLSPGQAEVKAAVLLLLLYNNNLSYSDVSQTDTEVDERSNNEGKTPFFSLHVWHFFSPLSSAGNSHQVAPRPRTASLLGQKPEMLLERIPSHGQSYRLTSTPPPRIKPDTYLLTVFDLQRDSMNRVVSQKRFFKDYENCVFPQW